MVDKKIKELLIGTNNKGKLREIRDLLPKYIKTYSTSSCKQKTPRESGKTFEDNWEIYQNLETIAELNTPLLIAMSRKSMLKKIHQWA